jgi:tight adherence protein B
MVLILFFAFTMLVTVGATLWATRKTPVQKLASARLSEISKARSPETHERQIALATKSASRFSDRIGEFFENRSVGNFIERLILHSGAKTTVGQVVLAGIVSAVFCGLLGKRFTGVFGLALLTAAAGAYVPIGVLSFKKSRRLGKFNEALPDAIDLMSRALRAGHSMSSSIEVIAQQSPEPLSSEFEACFQQQKFGIPFRESMLAMGERIPSDDLHFFITAILVQKETGGDLTDILDRTTRLIRERIRIQGEIRTHTAQGRLTGWILALMPVAMLLLMNVITPGYSDLLFHNWLGQRLLIGGAVLIVIGGLIIRKIVDIKV